MIIWGFPRIRGTFFGGPYNKDYSRLGSIFGSPHFGKLPYECWIEGLHSGPRSLE